MAKEYIDGIHSTLKLIMIFITIIYAIPACASPLPSADVVKEAHYFIPDAGYKGIVKTRFGEAYKFGRKTNLFSSTLKHRELTASFGLPIRLGAGIM